MKYSDEANNSKFSKIYFLDYWTSEPLILTAFGPRLGYGSPMALIELLVVLANTLLCLPLYSLQLIFQNNRTTDIFPRPLTVPRHAFLPSFPIVCFTCRYTVEVYRWFILWAFRPVPRALAHSSHGACEAIPWLLWANHSNRAAAYVIFIIIIIFHTNALTSQNAGKCISKHLHVGNPHRPHPFESTSFHPAQPSCP